MIYLRLRVAIVVAIQLIYQVCKTVPVLMEHLIPQVTVVPVRPDAQKIHKCLQIKLRTRISIQQLPPVWNQQALY